MKKLVFLSCVAVSIVSLNSYADDAYKCDASLTKGDIVKDGTGNSYTLSTDAPLLSSQVNLIQTQAGSSHGNVNISCDYGSGIFKRPADLNTSTYTSCTLNGYTTNNVGNAVVCINSLTNPTAACLTVTCK